MSDRRFREARKRLAQIRAEVAAAPYRPPAWRKVLAKIGMKRPLVRGMARETVKRAAAVKYAMKKTSHALVRS